MKIFVINKNWPDVKVLYTSPTDIISKTCRAISENISFDLDLQTREELLVILEPIVCVSEDTLRDFTNEIVPSAMKIGDKTVALYFPENTLSAKDEGELRSAALKPCYMSAEQAYIAEDAYNTYLCQESLKNTVNESLLIKGVFITDVVSTIVSPLAEIESGVCILPNCQIYGGSVVKSGAVIGPNAVICDSTICENAKINASQVFESTVGANTTVGPFAYIRPKSSIGEDVKIGDFVEIKKSVIGNGTKISHFAYIGDSEIGKKVNFSCGAITVNYDGKNKYKTKVGDNCFIGCNANLVAPVEIGDGAFVAAGSTITENVPPMALSVARARQYTKPEWAKKRREDGKL